MRRRRTGSRYRGIAARWLAAWRRGREGAAPTGRAFPWGPAGPPSPAPSHGASTRRQAGTSWTRQGGRRAGAVPEAALGGHRAAHGLCRPRCRGVVLSTGTAFAARGLFELGALVAEAARRVEQARIGRPDRPGPGEARCSARTELGMGSSGSRRPAGSGGGPPSPAPCALRPCSPATLGHSAPGIDTPARPAGTMRKCAVEVVVSRLAGKRGEGALRPSRGAGRAPLKLVGTRAGGEPWSGTPVLSARRRIARRRRLLVDSVFWESAGGGRRLGHASLNPFQTPRRPTSHVVPRVRDEMVDGTMFSHPCRPGWQESRGGGASQPAPARPARLSQIPPGSERGLAACAPPPAPRPSRPPAAARLPVRRSPRRPAGTAWPGRVN